MCVSTVSSIFMHLTNIYLAPLYAGAVPLSKEGSSCREPGPLALRCTPLGRETDPKGANRTPHGPVPVGVRAGRTRAGPLWTGLGLGPRLCGALRVGAPGRRQSRGYESVVVGVSAHRPVWLASWRWGTAGAEVREGLMLQALPQPGALLLEVRAGAQAQSCGRLGEPSRPAAWAADEALRDRALLPRQGTTAHPQWLQSPSVRGRR